MTGLLCLLVGLLGQNDTSPLRFKEGPDRSQQVIARLPEKTAVSLPKGQLMQEQGEAVLRVTLLSAESKKPGPAMLGKYVRNDSDLVFTPRFPFNPGQNYRATLDLAGKTMTLDYRVPELAKHAPPKVVKVYPTSDVLPANQLKFYIYFDRPMRGGKAIFNQIVLVDDKGKVIEDAWLIDEIWDEENNCLIIYIHPGRIKWGVDLRELLGPVLVEKRQYSLVVRGEMCDLDGNKIGMDFVKKFRTTPEDRVRIDLAAWKLTAPKTQTREPLTLTLPKSIDHRSLGRFLSVIDDKGQAVEGAMKVGKEEKSWQFTPVHPWQASGYHLDIDGRLEDVAGNTPLRAFDLDLTAPKLPPQKLRMGFQPR